MPVVERGCPAVLVWLHANSGRVRPLSGAEFVASITVSELGRRLRRRKKTEFVGLTAITDPGLLKRGNDLGPVAKVANVSGPINWDYARSVNRQRKREKKPADFHVIQNGSTFRIKGSPLRQLGKGRGRQLYLWIKIQSARWHYIQTETLDVLDPADVSRFLPAKSKHERQGVQVVVEPRQYNLKHIAELRIAGSVWNVRPLDRTLKTYSEAIATKAAA